MALSIESTANSVADHWASLGVTYSLHTADPGDTGANEATGGGYARQDTTWASASGGIATGSQITFSVLAGTYTHMCRWNGATLRDVIDTADATITPDGEIKVTPSSSVPFA